MTKKPPILRRVPPDRVDALRPGPVDAATLAEAAAIVGAVREEGWPAVERYARRFAERPVDGRWLLPRRRLVDALEALPWDQRALLERTAARIRSFAEAQRRALTDVDVPIPGGRAGHRVIPVDRAGCYAPGGRHPLPSSVLMTAVTARTAGVAEVWVASPNPVPLTLAAAAVGGADGLLAAGGAHAVAALAFGAGELPSCDVVAGPGNRWVTAAKQLVAGNVGIDMLAGPSELVVLADGSADPVLAAADLLAQAEHDPDAVPILVSTSEAFLEAVDVELEVQLTGLSTARTAHAALSGNGFAVPCPGLDTAIAVCERLAPEHLQVVTRDPRAVARRIGRYGAVFLGPGSAEVLGDYGAGPNHTLPTGGAARYTGGLSVLHFLAVRTWLELDDPAKLAADAAALARCEGLEAHVRAAELRR